VIKVAVFQNLISLTMNLIPISKETGKFTCQKGNCYRKYLSKGHAMKRIVRELIFC
jgi:hypothetical protein